MVQKRLSDYIKQMGIKQSVIALKTGIDPVIISAIMTGRRKLTADEFEMICRAIERQPNDFMCLEKKQEAHNDQN